MTANSVRPDARGGDAGRGGGDVVDAAVTRQGVAARRRRLRAAARAGGALCRGPSRRQEALRAPLSPPRAAGYERAWRLSANPSEARWLWWKLPLPAWVAWAMVRADAASCSPAAPTRSQRPVGRADDPRAPAGRRFGHANAAAARCRAGPRPAPASPPTEPAPRCAATVGAIGAARLFSQAIANRGPPRRQAGGSVSGTARGKSQRGIGAADRPKSQYREFTLV